MGKKKKRHTNKPKSLMDYVGYALCATVILYIIGKGGYETYINSLLRREGTCTEAIVYDRYRLGKKGDVVSKYKFLYNGALYEGKSNNDRKTEGKTWLNDKLIVGDTIIIVFLEDSPEVNRSNTLIEKDCECQ
ncbi:hypothetical protein [Dysgonomonas massiliensis]|uniref:hypothetical protein n=1 Tax=Dysgonomonas massiliensis TaxID=2040292 RepID=UPI000C77FEC8|nr:hypothetical protein [Dysgonomonas massiliensis]